MDALQLLSNPEKLRLPPNPDPVIDLAKRRNIPLPNDYLQFIDRSDGYEGFTGNGAYIALYQSDYLVKLNTNSDLISDLPGLLIVGGDGGGLGIGIDGNSPSPEYVVFDWIINSWEEVLFRGTSLREVDHYLADS